MKKLTKVLSAVSLAAALTVGASAATLGDVNGDGAINSADALSVLKYSVGITDKGFIKANADVNGDGTINSSDALKILKVSVGLETIGKIPSTNKEIVNYYNTATAKVATKKAPFSKSRMTVEKSCEAGLSLKAFKSIVNKFMGVGDENKFTKSVTSADAESYHKYFQASKLTASDVKSATCTKSGNNYTIALYIKNGSSSVKDGKVVSSNNSPLDRSGLACGDKDKDYWDHKTAENVMSAISEVPGCGNATISESYSNAVITAVINASTGNLVSLTAKFDFKFELSNIMGSSGKSTASSTVSMTGFKM